MTATLLVIVPVALLVLIGGFYFVGCTLDAQGSNYPPFTTYSDSDVIPSCVAYWPLNEQPSQFSTTAQDVGGKFHNDPHDGTYIGDFNAPKGMLPCPPFQFGGGHSPGAPGTLTSVNPGIVRGDTVPPHDVDNVTPYPGVRFDGGFVTVPVNATCNPPVFSIECWVKPEWNEDDPPATRQIIDSRNVDMTGMSGYGLRINDDGNWHAQIGHTNSGGVFMDVIGGIAMLNTVSHVVLTFDGMAATVFVNGIPNSPLTAIPGIETFSQNTVAPLIIGAGGPYLANRTTGAVEPPPLFPFVPFRGVIQCVAIYNTALSGATIKSHYDHGQGLKDG